MVSVLSLFDFHSDATLSDLYANSTQKLESQTVAADLGNLLSKPPGYYESDRRDMLKYIPEGVKTSLEFGCGTGGFSAILKEKFGTESWAVEIDKASATEAGKKLDKVINADAYEALVKIPKQYFDCIVLLDILEHLIDPYYFLNELKSKLKQGGVIVLSIPNIRYYRVFMDYVFGGNWEYKDHGVLDKTHLKFFTRKSLDHMFRQLGFEILTLEGIHPTFKHVPPSVLYFSTMAVFIPSCAHRIAAT